MILGHEGCAEVVKVGELVKDFKPGDRVLVPAITPDWNSLEAQAGYSIRRNFLRKGLKKTFIELPNGRPQRTATVKAAQ